MHVFGYSIKTHFGLQGGIRVYEKKCQIIKKLFALNNVEIIILE